jgi:hypothetical protein
VVSAAFVSKKSPPFIQILHERLGHINFSTRKKMNSADFDDGLVINNPSDPPAFCEGCIFCKHHRLPFPTSSPTRATKQGGLIHSDLCGPMSVPSLIGSLFFSETTSLAMVLFGSLKINQKGERT